MFSWLSPPVQIPNPNPQVEHYRKALDQWKALDQVLWAVPTGYYGVAH